MDLEESDEYGSMGKSRRQCQVGEQMSTGTRARSKESQAAVVTSALPG